MERLKYIPAILIFILAPVIGAFHPIHISVTDVTLDRNDKELEIIIRIFTDDMEKEIRKETGEQSMDILNPTGTTSDKLFEPYLKKHFRINVNGTDRNFRYLGHEVEAGSVVSYVLVSDVSELKKVKLFNDILISIHDDQVNLVHFSIDDDIHTMKFEKNQESQEREF